MGKKFNITQKKGKTKGKYNEEVINITPKGQTTKPLMTMNDLKKFYDKMASSGIKSRNIIVKIEGKTGFHTIKGQGDKSIREYDDEEYWKDKVKNPEEFTNFYFAQIIIRK